MCCAGIARSIPETGFAFTQVLAAGKIINTSLCLLQTAQVLVSSFWLLCRAEAQLLSAGLGGLIKPPDGYGWQEKPAHILS